MAISRWAYRLWSIIAGTFLCWSHLTSLIALGWLFRWTQQRVYRGLWQYSSVDEKGTFEDFCESLNQRNLSSRPRWILAEHIQERVQQPTRFRAVLQWLLVPWWSLWLNFRLGVIAFLCIFLLTGWGCLLMQFSWDFGWLNSFNKGYEQAFLGPSMGIIGIFLFILAMLYVPMARAHFAATGDYLSFFHFRFVWRLIRSRPVAYLGLATLIALMSLPLELLRIATYPLGSFYPPWRDATDAELLTHLNGYYTLCALVLFISMFITFTVAARVYRKSLLHALETGTISSDELHPTLKQVLERLGLLTIESTQQGVLGKVIRGGAKQATRWAVGVLLILVWFGFLAKTYVGEFLNRHQVTGFLNHPLVQIPCMTHIPASLEKAAKEM